MKWMCEVYQVCQCFCLYISIQVLEKEHFTYWFRYPASITHAGKRHSFPFVLNSTEYKEEIFSVKRENTFPNTKQANLQKPAISG